jgi:hypothetical protein
MGWGRISQPSSSSSTFAPQGLSAIHGSGAPPGSSAAQDATADGTGASAAGGAEVDSASRPASATLLDPKLEDKPLVRYGFLYFIPEVTRQITFADGLESSRKFSVEFYIAAYDVYGKLITGLSQTITPLPVTVAQYPRFISKPLQFFEQLDLPAGGIFLRTGVLDDGSEKVGTLEIPLMVKKKPAGTSSPPGGRGGG